MRSDMQYSIPLASDVDPYTMKKKSGVNSFGILSSRLLNLVVAYDEPTLRLIYCNVLRSINLLFAENFRQIRMYVY